MSPDTLFQILMMKGTDKVLFVFVGIELTELTLKGGIKFKVWDFAGQQEYYATHQCFLSSLALYLLVWKMTDETQVRCGQRLEPKMSSKTSPII